MDWTHLPRSAVNGIRRWINRELNQFSYNRQTLQTLGGPEVFQVELTNHCPMTCVMCPRTYNMSRALGYMDAALYEKIVNEISKFSSRIFLHHFGDSLMHPELPTLIRSAAQHDIKTFLSTNPILLTNDRARGIVDSGLHELVISLDGVSPETNLAIRGRAASDVARAEEQIEFLLQYRQRQSRKKPRIILQFVRQKMNLHEYQAWIEKWRSVEGIDHIKVKSFVSWDGHEQKINALRPELTAEPNEIVCDKPWTSVTILWDGRVVPCCFDYDGLFVLGDLREQTLDQIWRGEAMTSLRQAHRDRNLSDIRLCKNCTDKEGYAIGKPYYPINRLLTKRMPLAEEEDIAGGCSV